MLGILVIEHHLGRTARRPINALGYPVVLKRDKVRPANSDDIKLHVSDSKIVEPVRVCLSVRVEVGDDFSAGSPQSYVPGSTDPLVRRADVAKRKTSRNLFRRISRPVVDDNHLVIWVLKLL